MGKRLELEEEKQERKEDELKEAEERGGGKGTVQEVRKEVE